MVQGIQKISNKIIVHQNKKMRKVKTRTRGCFWRCEILANGPSSEPARSRPRKNASDDVSGADSGHLLVMGELYVYKAYKNVSFPVLLHSLLKWISVQKYKNRPPDKDERAAATAATKKAASRQPIRTSEAIQYRSH